MSDYTIAQFALALGVSKPTIWKFIGNGDIEAYKIGRAVRIPSNEYDRFISSNRIVPKFEGSES